MRVRLFAILRELAGSSEVEADGSSVEQVVQILCDRYGERFTEVTRSSQVVVDGEVAPLDLSLEGREEVALLPPVSGG
ncbi:MAG: MoaD/ThiS family protein [Actinomycetota bacterium]